MTTTLKTPVHQWTNGGDKVLVLRFSDKEGKAYGDFQHPLNVGESVTAPDWNATPKCGGGIHGWAWGIGIGDGKDPQYTDALWQVYEVDPVDIVLVESKVKFRTGVLKYSGSDWHGAFEMILRGQMAWVFHNSDGSASNSGYSGSASNSGYSGSASNSGYSGSASNSGDSGSASNSGDSGSASNSGSKGSASNSGYSGSASNSGDYGSASNSGYSGSASNSGDYGSASNSGSKGSASNSGDYGSASNSGDYGSASTTADGSAAIVTGLGGKAKAAKFGCIALAWWNAKESRIEMRCAQIGSGKGKLAAGTLKPDTWYMLNDRGKFVLAK